MEGVLEMTPSIFDTNNQRFCHQDMKILLYEWVEIGDIDIESEFGSRINTKDSCQKGEGECKKRIKVKGNQKKMVVM